MKKLLVVLVVLALAPLSLAACGGDDDDGGDEAAPTEEATGNGGGGEASTLQLSADPGGELAYDASELEASAGELTIELDNPASIAHDVCIEGAGGEDLGCSEQVTDSNTSLTATVEPGDYTFYCSVAGHREAGMEGPLVVN